MKSYIKYLFVAVFCGVILCGGLNWVDAETVDFSQLILKFGFSEIENINRNGIMQFLTWYFPMMVFQIFFGTYIYRHFSTASVYYFSRCDKRASWFLKKAAPLYLFVLIYLALLLGSGMAAASILNHIVFSRASFLILGYYVLLHSFWLFMMTLLVNICAIKWGSRNGFVIAGGAQIFCAALFAVFETVFNFNENTFLAGRIAFLQLNPIAHIVFPWHTSGIEEIGRELSGLGVVPFDLNFSVRILFISCLLVLAAGCITVRHQEFIITNKEDSI